MILVVLALAAGGADPVTDLIDTAEARMSPGTCGAGVTCPAPVSYRIRDGNGANTAADPTSKDRAFADDGTYCGVVGDKYCLSRPRLHLRALLPGGSDGGTVKMDSPLPHR